MSAGELTAFLHAFPKGGELHNHLGGGTPAEDLLAWAVEDGGCVDVVELAIRAACAGPNMKPAAEVLADEPLRSALIDSLTVRHPGFRDRSGHDQFFSAFARRGFPPKRAGDALAETLDGLARQNTFYAELMLTPQFLASRGLGARVGWKGDPASTRAALTDAGIEKLVPAAIADTDAIEKRAREVMQCGTPQAHPGCQVTVRYLFQAMREGPPEQTMAQLQLGVATIAADKRWVGLQLVSPEDGVEAVKYYDVHMQIVAELTDHGRKVPVSLHAGELSLKLATPQTLSYHVRDAVRVAGPRRIGHGTDLPGETGAEAIAAEMASKGVLVEVNLLSNETILEVRPEDHPYAWLRQKGVPVSLSTDDAGITRSGRLRRSRAERRDLRGPEDLGPQRHRLQFPERGGAVAGPERLPQARQGLRRPDRERRAQGRLRRARRRQRQGPRAVAPRTVVEGFRGGVLSNPLVRHPRACPGDP
jgi:adenosine deaminase